VPDSPVLCVLGEHLLALVDDAALVAGLNCTRVGADPPTGAELDAARSAR
jgi:fructokinase